MSKSILLVEGETDDLVLLRKLINGLLEFPTKNMLLRERGSGLGVLTTSTSAHSWTY